jgi:hypothetical protein
MILYEIRLLTIAYAGRSDPEFLNNVDHLIRAAHRWVEGKWLGREQYFVGWGHNVMIYPGYGDGGVSLPKDHRPSGQLTVSMVPVDEPNAVGRTLERVPMEAFASDTPWRLSDGTLVHLADQVTRGDPRAFGVYFGRTLAWRPLAARQMFVDLAGNAWSQPLNFDSDETVVTQQAPYAVVYAALRETWAFLGDPVQKATWEAEALRAVEQWMGDSMHQDTAAQGLPLVMQTPG